MPARVVVPPSTEPITLAQAKAQLRLEESIDDTQVETMIKGARSHVEMACGRALLLQTMELVAAGFVDENGCPLRLAGGHLADDPQAVVTYLDTDGVEQTLASGFYVSSGSAADAGPGRLHLMPGSSWPAVASRVDAVRVRFRVGWATPEEVPQDLRHAVLLMISHMYEHRTPVAAGGASELPLGFDALLNPHRFWRT